MPLIVEDGTGRENAESYVALAFADDYHERFDNAGWADADEPAREAALRRATQYLDTRYTFGGEPLTDTQALAWPRTLAPWPVRAVQAATCELAIRALAGQLYTDAGDAPVVQETVGPISVTYGSSQNGGQPRFVVVEDMLRGLFASVGRMTLRLERAS